MQVSVASHNIRTSGMDNAETMTINAAAAGKLFDLLIRYNNPVLAVIREYCCNALDIHSVTKQTRPFIVALPSAAEPMFRIRDWGTGLSHDEMRKVYFAYLNSTKDNSNDQVGGFGLGSKSAFGYVDMYTVTSFQDGWKSVYSAFRGPTRDPQLSLVERVETDEPDGIEVCVPVRAADIYRFANETQNVLQFFDPGTFELIGGTVTSFNPAVKGDGWMTSTDLKKQTYHSYNVQAKVKMGPVAYKVDWTQVGDSIPLNGLIIDVPMGSVTLPFTREEVSIDEKTKLVLRDRLDEVRKDALKQLMAEIEGAPSLWEAACAVHRNSTYLKIFGGKADHVLYQGVRIQLESIKDSKLGRGCVLLEVPADQQILEFSLEKLDCITPRWNRNYKHVISPANDFIIIDDVSATTRQPYIWSRLQANKQLIRLRISTDGISNVTGYVVPNSPDAYKMCGHPSSNRFFLMSELTLPQGQGSVKNPSADPVVYIYKNNSWQQSRFKDQRGDKPLFIKFSGSSPALAEWSRWRNIEWCRQHSVIGMPKRAVEEADYAAYGMEELTAFAKRKADELLATPDYQERLTNTVQYNAARLLKNADSLSRVAVGSDDKLLAQYHELFETLCRLPRLQSDDFHSIRTLIDLQAIPAMPAIPAHPVMAVHKRITEGYPVLNWMLSAYGFNILRDADRDAARKAASIKR